MHKLKIGDGLFYIVKGEDTGTPFGEFKAFLGETLAHNGTAGAIVKVSAGENYGEQPSEAGGGFVIVNGTKVFGTFERMIPHGDPGKGDTFVFPDELPAGFPRG